MSATPKTPGCCCACASQPTAPIENPKGWNGKYFATVAGLAALWWLVYSSVLPASHWLVFKVLGLDPDSHWGLSLEFFLYDTVKILLLLVALIYGIAWIRASLNVERVRDFLAGKRRGLGYFLGATFGAVTPFCSCSSIPLFLGFTTARIPIGITMSFLITSPLINEIAVVLLWGLLGWKFTLMYVLVGMAAGIIGGFVMDGLNAGRWLQPFILETLEKAPAYHFINEAGGGQKLTIRQRHSFAYSETASICKRVWKWVIMGVGIGAALHGFVPDNWFADNLGSGEWWSVPAAVLVAIPLYSNVTGIIPIMESLLTKGLPIGTTLAFCMSAVAASIPEVMMLRQIMTIKLQATFIGYLWVIFTVLGWLFNILGPYMV
ncbi:permease [Desulfovibrio sp. ZJ369]|uniref:permease n=1 Tax=Desulfovibrio sp. ZJ369 TaxID=2709793 RepID=UPI0013EE02EB|nr:permease [Desulfovibrio sp. ZJ369]